MSGHFKQPNRHFLVRTLHVEQLLFPPPLLDGLVDESTRSIYLKRVLLYVLPQESHSSIPLQWVKVIKKWRETCLSLKTDPAPLSSHNIEPPDLTRFGVDSSVTSRMWPVTAAHWPLWADASAPCVMAWWCTWLPKWFSARERENSHSVSHLLFPPAPLMW